MAAGNIKGITIEIGGDVTKLDKALAQVNKNSKNLQSELKQVDKLLKLDPKNTELLAQKQEILKEAISETSTKLNVLKEAEKQVQKQFENGEVSEKQYRELQREIIATEENLKGLERQAKESNKTLEDVGEAAKKLGKASEEVGKKLLTVSAGIGALGAASIASFNEVDSGYDTIITKTGATGDALEGLQDSMDNIFSTMPIEAETAGVAIGEVNTRFQETGEKLEDLSGLFIQFSEINNTDLTNSIASTDKIMEQWNISTVNTGKVLGLITKRSQETGISVDDLMGSVQENGAVFKEMGFNLIQSVNLLSEFEKNGINAETAMAGLKKSVAAYTKEGKTTEEGLQLTIDSIKNAETSVEALSIASEIFGKKGAAEMTSAIREGRFSVEDLSRTMNEYGTVVEDTFNATLDPPDKAKVALNNLKLAGADLGNTLLTMVQPAIEKTVEKVKEVKTWISGLSEAQKENIVKVVALIAAIGPALIIFGKLSTGIGNVVGIVSKLGTAISGAGGLSGVLTAITGPVGIIIGAIAALAAGFIYLYKTNDDFKNKANETFAKVKEAFAAMWTAIKPLLETLKEAFNNLMIALAPVFEAILTYVGSIVMAIMAAIEPIIAAITNVVDFVTNIINAVIALFTGDFDGFFQYLAAALQNVIDFISNIINAIITYIVTLFAGLGIDLKQIFQNIWDGIVNIFSAIGTWFSNRAKDIKNAFLGIGEWFTSIFESAWQGIKNVFAGVGEFFSGLWNIIVSTFVGIGTKIGDAVGGAFKGAINGVFSTIEGIVNNFIGFINGAIGIINEIPGVNIGSIGTVSLPRLAKGGVLREGQAIMAEAGPELISMVNGNAIVTPLTRSARNTALEGTGQAASFNQVNNIYSPKALSPSETARQTRIATQNMALKLRRA